MSLKKTIAQSHDAIVGKWIDKVLSTYAKDGANFFKKQQDRFANPLGYNLREGLEKVFFQLCSDDEVGMPKELSQFVKLRAVQTFKPSEALSFVYELKKVLVDVCGASEIAANAKEWLVFEKKIDTLALDIFDLFMADRERLYKIKINEFKTGNHIMSGVQCPSGRMKNNEEKIELKVIEES